MGSGVSTSFPNGWGNHVEDVTCSLCNCSHPFFRSVTEEFREYFSVVIECQKSGLKSPKQFYLCEKCYAETKFILEEMKLKPIGDLPMYMGSKNLFVLYYIAQKMKEE